jgi:replicative DNA helicase
MAVETAEHDYLCGLLELCTDDAARAREALRLVRREAFSGNGTADVYDLVCEVLSRCETPSPSDLAYSPHYEGCRELLLDLIARSIKYRAAYSLGVERFAWYIRADWRRRLCAEAAGDLAAAVKDPSASSADILAATRAVQEAAESVENADRTETLTDAVNDWLIMEDPEVVATGFAPVDSLCGGGIPIGGLFVLAAPPSVGKSALALQLTIGALDTDEGLTAVWCMGEMRKEALARRAACHWSTRREMHKVSMSSADQRTDLARGAGVNMANAIGDRLAFVKPPLTIQKIEQTVIEKRAKLVVIDYVQLVELEGASDRRAEIDGIVKRVRRLSLEHGVAVVCVSNIAKLVSAETRIGAIGKESSELDFAADILLLGVTEAQEDGNGVRGVRWACKKNRHGACEDIDTMFDGRMQTFTAPQQPEYDEFKPGGW